MIGPAGVTVFAMFTVPVKLSTLATVSDNVEASVPPSSTVNDPTDGWRSKYGSLVNFAVCTVSGLGTVDPLVIVTQVPPLTLVVPHPVWNAIGVLKVAPVMLYIAVKSRPVTGVLVKDWDPAE